MIISQIELKDIDEIYEISIYEFQTESWTKNQYIDAIKNKDYLCYCLKKDNKIVSYIICICSLDDVNILMLATKQGYKRKNYAYYLCEKVINEQLNENKSISLEVKSSNVFAINLYNKLGFKQEFLRKKYYKDGSDACIMFKRGV